MRRPLSIQFCRHQDQQVSSRGGPFTALNSAAARSVLAVWIPAGAAVEAPLYILHIATGGDILHLAAGGEGKGGEHLANSPCVPEAYTCRHSLACCPRPSNAVSKHRTQARRLKEALWLLCSGLERSPSLPMSLSLCVTHAPWVVLTATCTGSH